ncbi:hypothetical protein FRC03_004315 [Tulasnella sp. 419]|nr:hypothetical protein FRC03_004315 [Tulasnella sp. 419]
MSKEEKLWIARGRTRTNSGSDSGLIQIHDVERGESKVITGLAFCVTEAEVYDKKRRLLLSCNANEETLSVEIQQLDDIGQGDHFGKVSVNLPILEKDDAPAIIRVLEGLPVVAVITCKDIIYFFELHSGAFLYSQDFRPDTIWGAKDDEQSILLTSRDWNVANRISVNREDLIGYVRQVLGDDTLASSIAVRTGLPGAEDVLLNDMHGDYQRFMVQSVNEG